MDLEKNPGASGPAPIAAAQRVQVQAMLETTISQWLETCDEGLPLLALWSGDTFAPREGLSFADVLERERGDR